MTPSDITQLKILINREKSYEFTSLGRVEAVKALKDFLYDKAEEIAASLWTVSEKYRPCGCVLCTCENVDQCQGCGSKYCDEHNPLKAK